MNTCWHLVTAHLFVASPGYKDTARMCVEAALALVELPKSQKAGGVYSPAAACGEGLFDRLLATGTTWEVIELWDRQIWGKTGATGWGDGEFWGNSSFGNCGFQGIFVFFNMDEKGLWTRCGDLKYVRWRNIAGWSLEGSPVAYFTPQETG